MPGTHRHRPEMHYAQRTGWLRAAVLGANDGIVSTASLVVGVAAAQAVRGEILLAGIAGLVAGAMSMAAGEYVSVSSQSDTEKADLAREWEELEENPDHEKRELAEIYVNRGIDRELAHEVAKQLMSHDALGAHARDELGLHEVNAARPLQAATVSATTFSAGAMLPLAAMIVSPTEMIIPAVCASSLISLALLGGMAARTGGANPIKGASRVCLWGSMAMAVTAVVGAAVGTVL
jgi:VIT1/CCC1 family predicted Fe2+/Mn2+ transporter